MMEDDKEKLLTTNRAFYAAFAAADYEAMAAVWSWSDQVSVIHPGRSALHGHRAVMDSWQQILDSAVGRDIRCINDRAYVHDDTGYVICHEVFPQGSLIATNIFVREGEDWYLVHHQAGPDTLHESTVPDANSKLMH